MVKTPEFPLQGRQVQSLVGELRSCIMIAMWPKKKTFKQPPFITVTCQILCKAFPPGDLHGFSTQNSGGKTHQFHFQMKKLRPPETWLGAGSVEIKWQRSGPADFQH